MSSNPQLQKRVDYDNKAMADAVSDLLSVVGRKRVERPSHERKEQLQMALEAIFAALSLPIPDVPQDVQELDLRLDYMLRPSGVMRRRVELKGRWWQNTMGPLLGSTKSGDVVAILPAPLGGYFFLDPSSGKRVKVKSKTAELLERDAFCFYRSLPARQLKIRDLLIFMLRSLDMGDVLFVLLLSLLVSLLGLFTPYMNKQIFDSVIPSRNQGRSTARRSPALGGNNRIGAVYHVPHAGASSPAGQDEPLCPVCRYGTDVHSSRVLLQGLRRRRNRPESDEHQLAHRNAL